MCVCVCVCVNKRKDTQTHRVCTHAHEHTKTRKTRTGIHVCADMHVRARTGLGGRMSGYCRMRRWGRDAVKNAPSSRDRVEYISSQLGQKTYRQTGVIQRVGKAHTHTHTHTQHTRTRINTISHKHSNAHLDGLLMWNVRNRSGQHRLIFTKHPRTASVLRIVELLQHRIQPGGSQHVPSVYLWVAWVACV